LNLLLSGILPNSRLVPPAGHPSVECGSHRTDFGVVQDPARRDSESTQTARLNALWDCFRNRGGKRLLGTSNPRLAYYISDFWGMPD